MRTYHQHSRAYLLSVVPNSHECVFVIVTKYCLTTVGRLHITDAYLLPPRFTHHGCVFTITVIYIVRHSSVIVLTRHNRESHYRRDILFNSHLSSSSRGRILSPRSTLVDIGQHPLYYSSSSILRSTSTSGFCSIPNGQFGPGYYLYICVYWIICVTYVYAPPFPIVLLLVIRDKNTIH